MPLKMKPTTIYLLGSIIIEILLIFIFITWLISPLTKTGKNTEILLIPIPVAALVSLVLGYLAGEYMSLEKIDPIPHFFLGVSVFCAIFVISTILGFGFFHLLYAKAPSGIWVFPSMFVFLGSVPILVIGCIMGFVLCCLKEDL